MCFFSIVELVVFPDPQYDPNHPAALGLEGFQRKNMSGGEFKELVRRTFGLKLTAQEVGALFVFFNQRRNSNSSSRNSEESEGGEAADGAKDVEIDTTKVQYSSIIFIHLLHTQLSA